MEVPRHWRLQKQRYALVGEICPTCQTKIFPPRARCPHCSNESQVDIAQDNPSAVYVINEPAYSNQ